ncbi:RidA family protein [Dactylosporangium matsuzakiense]|uniref:Enamine deaminase RidA (YjgF/YER057c/UK114 family) n=1 Tax=Dactylosporangium matsuzakiense TaxID=53360 RepID=A0A9W6KGV4_9ACTN|nr:RidA family protein [Dactylosporangium matsuzakiense]UWZ42183.1 RidA family protein [Dactylosporangium matsuzakiense]GLK99824.1 hypothetical protein GCM10017581_015650 [Dactylosporangium matsuzakiense]
MASTLAAAEAQPPLPRDIAYAQAALVTRAARTLFISGQVPEAPDGTVPEDFDAQCRQAWRNVLAVVKDAGMTERNLVKVTIFLSDRRHREANARIRHEVPGDHNPALTVIITGIYEEVWLLEIEAIAAA